MSQAADSETDNRPILKEDGRVDISSPGPFPTSNSREAADDFGRTQEIPDRRAEFCVYDDPGNTPGRAARKSSAPEDSWSSFKTADGAGGCALDMHFGSLANETREADMCQIMAEQAAEALREGSGRIGGTNRDWARTVSAKSEVKWFVRQLVNDRCFLAITALAILGIAFLIFWRIYMGRSDGGAPTTGAATVAPGR